MVYVALLFAGALFCNALPHLIAGLQGRPFPTPMAKPPGKGLSSALINFQWGAINLAGGVALLHYFPVEIGLNWKLGAFVLGALLIGFQCSIHFEKVLKGK
jgi:hypothetical protein